MSEPGTKRFGANVELLGASFFLLPVLISAIARMISRKVDDEAATADSAGRRRMQPGARIDGCMSGPAWTMVFVAGLAGQRGRALSHDDAEAPLKRMVEAIKSGSQGSFVPFDREGEPLLFE